MKHYSPKNYNSTNIEKYLQQKTDRDIGR